MAALALTTRNLIMVNHEYACGTVLLIKAGEVIEREWSLPPWLVDAAFLVCESENKKEHVITVVR